MNKKKNIIVLISANDPYHKAFVVQSDEYIVRILSPGDLSLPGWYYDDDDKRKTVCITDSESLEDSKIDGVISRLPAVPENELSHIVSEDRSYLAAEMTAFLLAWLSSLNCPMLNRPTASCLSGPYLRPEQWVYHVAQMGIPVVKYVQKVKYGLEAKPVNSESLATVVVIGNTHVGDAHSRLVDHSHRIARSLNIDFLAVSFSHSGKNARFISGDLWPVITDEIASLMLDFMVFKHADVKHAGGLSWV